MNEQLGNLAKIHYGKSPSEVLEQDGQFPIIGTGGRYGQANMAMFSGPAVVVPRKGSLGNPQLLLEPFWPVDTTYALTPAKDVDVGWLYYNLVNYDLTKLSEATGVPSISRDWLSKILFFNPSKYQKRKIGEILRAVDVTIEKTESLIAKYQQVKAGLMQDLFTRGVTADGKLRSSREQAPELYKETPIGWIPKEWECKTLEQLLAPVGNNLRSGPFGSALLKDELVEEGIPFLGIDNIYTEHFEAKYRRFVSQKKFMELHRYSVRPNDVVITIMGTVGRCCVLPDDIGQALSSKHLWTMTLDQSQVFPELVCWQLNYAPWVLSWFRRESQGAVMDAIQSSTLRTLRIPVPGMPEQEVIIERYLASTSKIESEQSELNKLKKKKAGLMHDLLTGRVLVVSE